LEMIAKMGNLKDLVAMVPGGSKMVENEQFDENEIFKFRTVIHSMSKKERINPELLRNRSRIQRIARGSGVSYHEVEKLVKSFNEMKLMLGKLKKGPNMMQKLLGKFMS
ncbi:MAG: signal recognition particle protein, partial [Planctomycetes bacterium]|nr:signal recognition particle protein [Planctomycetota bacterium]